eukprot:3261464-Lingulodinium_polyedra.AAC.1
MAVNSIAAGPAFRPAPLLSAGRGRLGAPQLAGHLGPFARRRVAQWELHIAARNRRHQAGTAAGLVSVPGPC